ncbi:hypothetical protein B0T17DRAFT_606177 [Bombardia bombarda]|uniref:RBR-type E3 ubiquitin transferase n=1 Tax=Bombardia bombarda TaxID=252184 RepID=A0AA39X776_9PEZI|nr:hypothetical protein B0T17DRAFT_606177 [Bombardia bombarda]
MAYPSLSLASSSASVLAHRPEVNETDYIRHVLGHATGNTEQDVEQELSVKANALGIDLPLQSRPSTATTAAAKKAAAHLSGAPSSSSGTTVSHHGRTASTSSNGTTNTTLTSQTSRHSSTVIPATLTESARRRSKSLSFSQYEKYLSKVDPALKQPKFFNSLTLKHDRSTGGGGGTRRSVGDLKRSITGRLRRRRPVTLTIMSCICCREDFVQDHKVLKTLPCGHTYCQSCLTIMIAQSTTDESRMPPRCCIQPIPGAIIKTVLSREEQQLFLKAVVQYNTPWESRMFCPNASCGEFIPPLGKIDPKHPFETVCKVCKTRVCTTCKRNAHRLGVDCPEDWELDAVLKMGEKSGWRRCYKCRTLVELSQGCTHMTCRCKAQFCYICGAVWEPQVGCPNFCNGEEELERRRAEEEARLAELEAEKNAQEELAAAEEREQLDAEKRTAESAEFMALREEQEAQLTRFRDFERTMKIVMWSRQSQKRLVLCEKYADLMDKMKERHAKTEQHLEDRQIEAEIELQRNLEQSEKSVRIRLKYMEAYCKGDVATAADTNTNAASRKVTEKHHEQLKQQYLVRDGMERRRQSQINVLREKQAKRMEELVDRHAKEIDVLINKRSEEVEDLAIEFANEEEALLVIFKNRKANLRKRWEVMVEILRVELGRQHGVRFTRMAIPEWPLESDAIIEMLLPAVSEEL